MWPKLKKFHYFGNIFSLWPFLGLFSTQHNFEPTLAKIGTHFGKFLMLLGTFKLLQTAKFCKNY